MKLSKRQTLILAGGGVALGLLLVAWRPQAVEVVQVRSQPLSRTLQFSARVSTPARVELGTTLTGRVAQVKVDEGVAFAARQPLIELEADEARAALDQAQASLSQARARLMGQQAYSRPSADAALAQAVANLQAAERELVRVRELVAQGFFSQQKLDEAQRALDVARAQRDAARAQSRANGERGAEVANAQAQVDAAEAAVAAARARLDQHTVRAPAAGQVLVRSVEPGQIVQAGKALLTVAVQGPLELVAQVDERFLGQLQAGQPARVLADAYPDRPIEAEVMKLAPSVNAQSGSVEVTLGVKGARPDFLREDMTLSVEVRTGERQAARVLPLSALRAQASPAATPAAAVATPDASRGEVLVVQEGRAELRALRLGLRTLSEVEVLQGLADGDAVVLTPGVAPQARVRVRPAPAAR